MRQRSSGTGKSKGAFEILKNPDYVEKTTQRSKSPNYAQNTSIEQISTSAKKESLGDVILPRACKYLTSCSATLTSLRPVLQAPLWVLLTRVCSHTRDGGALLHAVVAEELAEWSARLASDQTLASKAAPDQDDCEEEWGPRADRRADYWSEVSSVWTRLHSEDAKASEQLAIQVSNWLNQQDRQLQVSEA